MTRMFSGKPFARAEAWIKGHVSAGSYVRDGLVAMWDGIENAGWGVHSDRVEDFRELVSGSPCIVAGWCGAINSQTAAESEYIVGADGLVALDKGGNIGIGIPLSAFGGLAALGQNWTQEFARTRSETDSSQGAQGTLLACPTYAEANGKDVTANFGGVASYRWGGNLNVYYSGTSGMSGAEANPGFTSVSYGSGTTVIEATSNHRRRIVSSVKGVVTMRYSSPIYTAASTTHWCFANSMLKATLHNFRLYGRRLEMDEILRNQAVDRIRFGLP